MAASRSFDNVKVLINFATLKAGGGQNVAMNFLLGMESAAINTDTLLFLVARNSEPHKYLEKRGGAAFYIAPRNPLWRIAYECILLPRILKNNKVDVIYTYFGFSMYLGAIPQVSGSADSNIYYPEVDFWASYGGVERLKKKLVDKYRIWGIKKANAVVYENEALMRRAKVLHNVRTSTYIKPSVVVPVSSARLTLPSNVPTKTHKALFLCGWQANKNVMLIPLIARELKRFGVGMHFLLAAPKDNSKMHVRFQSLVEELHVSEMVTIIGAIAKDDLASLYSQVDYVMLLSKLESFSNNIIEAWQFRKPLVASSEDWAKAICKDAAVYVNRDSPEDVASKLRYLECNPTDVQNLINHGIKELAEYPSIAIRIREELAFLRSTVNAI